MTAYIFFYSLGLSILPALFAFLATLFHKRDGVRVAVSWRRRLASAAVIYAVVLTAYLALTVVILAAKLPSPEAYESPFLIVSGLVAYFAGYRVAFGHSRGRLPPPDHRVNE